MYPPNPPYPVRLDVEYPDSLSRLLIFVKWLLAVPHYFALVFLAIGAYVVWVLSFFAVLITGRYPEGMFNYMVGVFRWAARVQAYVLLMTDVYPPFSLEDDPNYPVRVELDYPQHMARWRPLVHWLLVIPVAFLAYLITIAADVCVILAWFAILITGRFPESMFNVVLIAHRWWLRTSAYLYWMEEEYPPFAWA